MALDGSSGRGLNPGTGPERRSFLFLQGPIGPFFPQVARRLRAAGHAIHRINFNGGDRLVWTLPGAVNFSGPPSAWPAFLEQYLLSWGVTDIVLFGDCRPLHQLAIKVVCQRAIDVHVFEEGYLRPNWVTMERGGVNKNSGLPRNPDWFKSAARSLREWDEGQSIPRNFAHRALWDIIHNLSVLVMRWRFPYYRTHRPWSAGREYAAGTRHFLRKPWTRRRAEALAQQLRSSSQPFYLFPLQLEADTQIRFHSPFGGMAPAIEKVIESFARCAPADTRLVLSEHPLDTAVVDQQQVTRRAAAAYGVGDRVIYLQCGTPTDLIQKSRGLVTVNSTVGIQAIGFGVPVKTLGDAIYDMPELTHQADLDDFWQRPQAPIPETYLAFRKVVGSRTQLNGSFFCGLGRALAVQAAADRLSSRSAVAAEVVRLDHPAPLKLASRSVSDSPEAESGLRMEMKR